MVYLLTLPGGWIADRWLGQRRSVLYGGILIASGHFSMAVPTLTMFYLGLVLIVIGTGLLKGNIAVLVGQLYAPSDNRRDAGFSIYYMGINLGAFLAPLVCGYLGQRVNWHLGFAAAGIGMVLGLVQYVLGDRHLGSAGARPSAASLAGSGRGRPAAGDHLERRRAVIARRRCSASPSRPALINVSAAQIAEWVGWSLLAGTVVFFGWLYLDRSWTPQERGRLYVVGVFFLCAAIFWSVFEQAGSTLNLFADRSTRNVVFGWSFPSSLVSVAERPVHHRLRADVRVALDHARPARAGQPDEVRVRPDRRRRRLPGAGAGGAGREQRRPGQPRCG